MQLSVRDAKARFAEAANAAANGERVVVTKHGKPFVELVAAKPRGPGLDFEKLAAIRKELGIDGITVAFDPRFDDRAYSRDMLGLDATGRSPPTGSH